jgi:hypothetical protein
MRPAKTFTANIAVTPIALDKLRDGSLVKQQRRCLPEGTCDHWHADLGIITIIRPANQEGSQSTFQSNGQFLQTLLVA